jgi:pyridoxal phosphate enzyme (YggS family)
MEIETKGTRPPHLLKDIGSNIGRIRARIELAATRAGRPVDDITVVAVSKGVGLESIGEAVSVGLKDFGENRVREAETKIRALPDLRWHMVGHLQRNKAQQAASIFSVIHSVDSKRLAADLSSRATGRGSIEILLQVNVAGEPRKFGIAPRDTVSFVREIGEMPGLRVVGLMTIAPQTEDPESVRPVFRRLRELRDEVRGSAIAGGEFAHLSMGMTDDFEVAIEEGATMVRIGRAIFGERT